MPYLLYLNNWELLCSKKNHTFLFQDRDGSVQLYWGTAGHGSLVCTDDPNAISAACGKRYAPFPPGEACNNLESVCFSSEFGH